MRQCTRITVCIWKQTFEIESGSLGCTSVYEVVPHIVDMKVCLMGIYSICVASRCQALRKTNTAGVSYR